ncbi:MAG: hypothetical protein V4696_00790 [Pseudomonadota bacterium]
MKRLMILLAALSLNACALPSFSLGAPAPAPLAATTIDDTALSTAWKSFDVALDAINLAIDAGAIKVGSPQAIKVADAIDRVTAALTAAESAAAAASTTSYKSALLDARAALAQLRLALKG